MSSHLCGDLSKNCNEAVIDAVYFVRTLQYTNTILITQSTIDNEVKFAFKIKKKKTKRKRHTTIQKGNNSKDNFSFRLLNSIFNYRKVLANLSHKYMAITLTVIPEREKKEK